MFDLLIEFLGNSAVEGKENLPRPPLLPPPPLLFLSPRQRWLPGRRTPQPTWRKPSIRAAESAFVTTAPTSRIATRHRPAGQTTPLQRPWRPLPADPTRTRQRLPVDPTCRPLLHLPAGTVIKVRVFIYTLQKKLIFDYYLLTYWIYEENSLPRINRYRLSTCPTEYSSFSERLTGGFISF